MYALASEHAAHGVPVPVGEPGIVDILLWGVLPYVTILILIGGTIWRYRTDQFSWTTRSSQIYESKMLRLGMWWMITPTTLLHWWAARLPL